MYFCVDFQYKISTHLNCITKPPNSTKFCGKWNNSAVFPINTRLYCDFLWFNSDSLKETLVHIFKLFYNKPTFKGFRSAEFEYAYAWHIQLFIAISL